MGVAVAAAVVVGLLGAAALLLRPAMRWYVARRWKRLAVWRAGLGPGDRCWVVTPSGEPRRMTIRSRDGDRVDLLLYVDVDGERCLMGIHVIRLFPDEPADYEIEAVEEALASPPSTP